MTLARRINILGIVILILASLRAFAESPPPSDELNKSKFSEGDWPERAADSIRNDLLNKRYDDAWRSTQLMLRTKTVIQDLDYMEKLSALLAGACSLDLAVTPVAFDHLLGAFGSRFYRRFSNTNLDLQSPMTTADSGNTLSYLNVSQAPFLKDIKSTKLIRGSGCRFARPRFRNTGEADFSELKHLLKYIERVEKYPDERPANDIRVRVRLLELANRLNIKELSSRLLAELTPLQVEPWLFMSESDRRFLWTILRANQKVPDGPIQNESPEDKLVEQLIIHSSPDEVGYWLAIAPIDNWTVNRRRGLFEKVDNLGSFPGRRAIVLRRALIAYESGKPREALEFTRRLLITENEPSITTMNMPATEDDTEAYALKLVESILSKYQYDDAVQASVQSSVPANHWSRIFRGLLVQHALGGDQKSYQRLRNQLSTKNPNQRNRERNQRTINPESLSILDAMTNRQISRLSSVLNKLIRDNRNEFLKLSRDIAVRVSAMNDDEFQIASTVLGPFIPILENERDRGTTGNKIDDLLITLTRANHSKKSETENAVRGGTSHVGRAVIRPLFELQNPFSWQPLDKLPLDPLVAMPDSARSRSWTVR